MGIWSKEKRSQVMSKIRSKNTKPEIILRSALHRLGYRFRVHKKDLPGKPDLVLPKYGTVIFVHGCFWHGHDCRYFRLPKTRTDFWDEKISGNRSRDRKIASFLRKQGGRSLRFMNARYETSKTGSSGCLMRWVPDQIVAIKYCQIFW